MRKPLTRGKIPRSMATAWSTAFTPLSWIYGGLAACRRGAYTVGLLRIHNVGIPVVSVGGLSLGGSGKTPVTRFIADQFTKLGIRVGVVHGAYLGQAHRRVSYLHPSLRWQPGAVQRFGDEAILLAGWLGDAIVTCGADKVAAARLAVQYGADLIVVDDGFQHLRLHRELDILVQGRGGMIHPLPAGLGREFFGAAGQADLLWGVDREGTDQDWNGTEIFSSLRPRRLISADGATVGEATELAGRSVFLMAGIAGPSAFVHVVRNLGAQIIGHTFARDHRPFSRAQFRAAACSGAELVLCTEKDIVRMWDHSEAGALTALTCGIEIIKGKSVLDQRLTALVKGIGHG